MRRTTQARVILLALAVTLCVASVASPSQHSALAEPAVAHTEFVNPEVATIQGYTGAQQDPVISPDGLYLFFDSHNEVSSTALLYWARRIDYKTFTLIGEVRGVNFPGEMTLRATYSTRVG